MSRARRLALFLFSAMGATAVAILAVVARIDGGSAGAVAAAALSAALHHEVRVGTVAVALCPRPALELGDVAAGSFLTLRRVVIPLELRPLLSGRLVPGAVRAEGVSLLVTRDPAGRLNVDDLMHGGGLRLSAEGVVRYRVAGRPDLVVGLESFELFPAGDRSRFMLTAGFAGGRLTAHGTSGPGGKIELDFAAERLSLGELWPVSGLAKGRGRLTVAAGVTSATGELDVVEPRLPPVDGYPRGLAATRLTARFRASGQELALDRLTVVAGGTEIGGAVTLRAGGAPSGHLHTRRAVSLAALRQVLPTLPPAAARFLSDHVTAGEFSFSDIDLATGAVSGSVKGGALAFAGQRSVTGIAAQFDYRNSRLRLSRAAGRLTAAPLAPAGEALRLDATVGEDGVRLDNIRLGGSTGRLFLAPDGVARFSFRSALAGGLLALDGTGGWRGDEYRVRVGVEGRRLAAAGLSRPLGLGRLLDADLNLAGELEGDMHNLLPTVSGHLAVSGGEGELARLGLAGTLFSYLNHPLAPRRASGLPFSGIAAQLRLRRGVVTLEPLAIKGEAINLSLTGDVDMTARRVDLAAGLQPLQSVDRIVSGIPLLGWVLSGPERSVLTAYFTLTGGWDDPDIAPAPIKTLGAGVYGILERTLTLPLKFATGDLGPLLGAINP